VEPASTMVAFPFVRSHPFTLVAGIAGIAGWLAYVCRRTCTLHPTTLGWESWDRPLLVDCSYCLYKAKVRPIGPIPLAFGHWDDPSNVSI
jgi:hypothetical protein